MTKLVRFIFVGGFAAFINVSSRVFLDFYLYFEISVVIAYLIAMTCAFIMNKRYVFDTSSLQIRYQFIRFSIVNIVSLIIVWGVSSTLYRIIFPYFNFHFYPDLISHIAGVISPVLLAFHLHQKYSFRI
jgi:putative flippase GtrA